MEGVGDRDSMMVGVSISGLSMVEEGTLVSASTFVKEGYLG